SVFQKKLLGREQVAQAVAEKVVQSTDWTYTPLKHSNFDIRINIEKNSVLVSVKVFSDSLYKREYDHQPTPGALRSTIAAAMLYELVQGEAGLKVVDNFCGSGTFLCEAARLGCNVYGSDINPGTVEIAKSNLQKVGAKGDVCVQNAAHTKWPDQFFGIAISNLPWDKQIEVASITQIIDSCLAEYARILKPHGKIGMISTKPEIVAKYLRKHFQVNFLQEYKIGYLGQTPTIQLAEVSTARH
ncbi:methyltransferase domain-containing protein, partial [Candidatus Dojkabacteria bacterium]|nr:methyltransferase domain-containing protein [Candidatus Dojkabacteria bacterium]